MRYLVDLPTSKVQAIKLLIESGKYEDVQSFILAALENQLYLEKQPIEHFAPAEMRMTQSFAEGNVTSQSLPLMFRPDPKTSTIITVQEPITEVINSNILWALYNRVFPVKVTLRVLANLLKSNSADRGYVDLFALADSAAEIARKLNLLLTRIDKKNHRIHGEKLSAGLPGAGNRALERFKSSFVGTINSRGHIEGAPAILRFVNIRKDEAGKPKIGITESGLQFAAMENPILDKSEYSQAFYDQEIAFYLRHISEKLPKEYQLSLNILRAIKNGIATPNELTRIVLEADSDLSSNEAQTMRSSAVSRLSELGMLARRRDGSNVTYSLSAKALTVLSTQMENKK